MTVLRLQVFYLFSLVHSSLNITLSFSSSEGYPSYALSCELWRKPTNRKTADSFEFLFSISSPCPENRSQWEKKVRSICCTTCRTGISLQGW
ncbi:hypothetical protein DER44DRAFT_772124 [Fusarium oxysporum]|nr:hypothetical protein DER44DRAFT_772124 [Fusarium oxysporum]